MDSLRTRSRWLSRAVLGVLLMLMVMPTVVAIAVISGRPYLDLLIRQLPMLFYACALWSIRGALSDYASGGSLSVRASSSIQVVGLNLFFGGLTDVFAVSLLLRAVHGWGSYGDFNVAAITLGAVGLSLVVIGRLLSDAEAARLELEEFV
jgi:hypothetical protein